MITHHPVCPERTSVGASLAVVAQGCALHRSRARIDGSSLSVAAAQLAEMGAGQSRSSQQRSHRHARSATLRPTCVTPPQACESTSHRSIRNFLHAEARRLGREPQRVRALTDTQAGKGRRAWWIRLSLWSRFGGLSSLSSVLCGSWRPDTMRAPHPCQ